MGRRVQGRTWPGYVDEIQTRNYDDWPGLDMTVLYHPYFESILTTEPTSLSDLKSMFR